jgi:hypothetical protein
LDPKPIPSANGWVKVDTQLASRLLGLCAEGIDDLLNQF